MRSRPEEPEVGASSAQCDPVADDCDPCEEAEGLAPGGMGEVRIAKCAGKVIILDTSEKYSSVARTEGEDKESAHGENPANLRCRMRQTENARAHHLTKPDRRVWLETDNEKDAGME